MESQENVHMAAAEHNAERVEVTDPHPGRRWRATRRLARFSARFAGIVALAASAVLLASVVAVPSIAPYHIRLRGVYLTLAPLTAGFLFGVAYSARARRNTRAVLAVAVLILFAALLPRVRNDLPAATLYPTLLAGAAVAMIFVRLGMLQAGIGWGGRTVDELILPRWMAVFAYTFAWAWLLAALLNPRETFAPTRWLLGAVGSKPPATALMPAQVHFKQYAVSGRAVAPDRGRVETGPYRLSVGPLVARPGEILVTLSAVRRDGAPFGHPMWLTVDADDPQRPDPLNDREHYGVSAVDGGTPEGKALLRSATARRFTGYAWFSVSQALPAVRLRARLWTLDRETRLGDLYFRPVAQADLGTWDLTVMSHLRAQPVR